VIPRAVPLDDHRHGPLLTSTGYFFVAAIPLILSRTNGLQEPRGGPVGNAPSSLEPPVHIESWRETTFGPVRIKLRRTEGPNLASLVPGDVLDTVSRRDPVRSRIGLWTSGNRVFSLDEPEAIGRLIELCHNDVMQSQFALQRTLSHARTVGISRRIARQLFNLLLIELQEHTPMRGNASTHD
jgi:hypothetical protein